MNLNKIRIRMLELNLSNRDIANYLKINENTISRWLKGNNLNQIEIFLKMLIYLDIDIKKLMNS